MPEDIERKDPVGPDRDHDRDHGQDLAEFLDRLEPEVLKEMVQNVVADNRLDLFDTFFQPADPTDKTAMKDFRNGRRFHEALDRVYTATKALGWDGRLSLEAALEAFRDPIDGISTEEMGKEGALLLGRVMQRAYRVLGNMGLRSLMLSPSNVTELMIAGVIRGQELEDLVKYKEILGVDVEILKGGKPLSVDISNPEDFFRHLEEGTFDEELFEGVHEIRAKDPAVDPEVLGEALLKALPFILKKVVKESEMDIDSMDELLPVLDQAILDLQLSQVRIDYPRADGIPAPQLLSVAWFVLKRIRVKMGRYLDTRQ